jgi:N-glycosylase/DNA lyase
VASHSDGARLTTSGENPLAPLSQNNFSARHAPNHACRHIVLHGRLLSLKQDSTHLHYKVTWPKGASAIKPPKQDDTEELLRHYFSLKHNAADMYDQWSRDDPNFRKKAPKFTGIRILSQDAWETLVGFICSSNNNISRISQMVHKLCNHYGPLIAHVGNEPFHDFPTADALTGAGVEAHLRELGFGYRAKYISQTATTVAASEPEWLERLTNPKNPGWGAEKYGKIDRSTYKDAHMKLSELSGVGPKVADCVCLMGLGWGEAVPVDTHVWQIAQRDYKFGGKMKTKTFNKVMYDSVGDHFRKIWGSQAGWAQSVLFTANLKSFADRKEAKVEAEDVKVEPDIEDVKVEVEEKVIVEDKSTTRSKRKRVTVTEKVKVEQVVSEIAVDTTSKRRRTRSSMN